MVGVAGQDRDSAIKLFQQHDSHKLMRPRGGAKGQRKVGALSHFWCEPIGAANDKPHCGTAIVAPAAETPRQGVAAHRNTARIQRNFDGTRRNHSSQRAPFFRDPIMRPARAAFPDFQYLDGLESDGAAGFRRALPIGFGKIAFGARLEPADSGDGKPHRCLAMPQLARRCPNPIHIFSRL